LFKPSNELPAYCVRQANETQLTNKENLSKEIRMRKRFGIKFFSVVALLVTALSVVAQQRTRPAAQRAPASTDIKIKYRNTFSGQTNESMTMIKGARERSENNFGSGISLVNITQCDLKRFIQMSEQVRKYVITPMETDTASDARQPSTAPATPGPNRRGGVVTYTSTATDTGERKEMFGFTARHIKTSLDIESSPDACNSVKQRMETDGWYIDLSVGLDCDLGRAQMMSRPQMPGGCHDQTRFKRLGVARTGYPLSETTTMYGPNGAVTFTATKEVVELSREPLDAALFEVPAGYTEAQSTQELYGAPSMTSMAGPTMPQQSESSPVKDSGGKKTAGALRIGVMPIDNKTDKTVSTETLRQRLIGEIQGQGLEAISLNAQTQIAADVEARAKECDFILDTDIAALKSSKVGGMFGRITGATGAGKTDARLDFKLFAVGETAPLLQSSAPGKADGEDESAGVAVTTEARIVAAEAKKKSRN
jgi:hypothetical protein